ncbi:MAG TPA: CIA30 family protein [Leeuwenhoekiella sp.]|nr:CIA30 family protein [Leeuwenhoekiella sp.]
MKTIIDFSENSTISQWKVVNDGVMGGLSKGDFYLDESGNGVFEGKISLENNGGFSSVQYAFEQLQINDFSQFVIRVKGDGKPYQFRVKSTVSDKHSYISTFKTTGEWQTITIAMSSMIPQFRGEKLPMTNYAGDTLEQVTFLFGNKKEETFKLEIDTIIME